MKRVVVIRNPAAARASRQGLETLIAVLAAEGLDATSVSTAGPGHAGELAAEAAGCGTDIVVVYGGDGTVMQAVEGLRGSNTVLGLVPGGTGNLLAGNLRIPRSPSKAARIIAAGVPRTIDLGRLETGDGTRFFAVGCGAGYDADLMATTTPESKRRWGIGAYIGKVVRTAHKVRPTTFEITVDGKRRRHQAVSVIVANCREIIPPVLALGPDITIDDGVLDVVIINAEGYYGAAMATWNLLFHQETGRVERLRGIEVHVDTETPHVVQADGDVCGSTPFTATMIKGGIRVMVPAARG